MTTSEIMNSLKKDKLAARKYEKSGHGKFRDFVTICRNGKACFERYCYGEAAGTVCTMWASKINDDGTIDWKYDRCDYSGKTEAPKKITGQANGALLFDDKKPTWEAVENMKIFPAAGLGFFKMIFAK